MYRKFRVSYLNFDNESHNVGHNIPVFFISSLGAIKLSIFFLLSQIDSHGSLHDFNQAFSPYYDCKNDFFSSPRYTFVSIFPSVGKNLILEHNRNIVEL